MHIGRPVALRNIRIMPRSVSLGAKTTLLLVAMVSIVLASASAFFLHYLGTALSNTILEGLDGQATIAALGIQSFLEQGAKESAAIAATFPVEALEKGRMD